MRDANPAAMVLLIEGINLQLSYSTHLAVQRPTRMGRLVLILRFSHTSSKVSPKVTISPFCPETYSGFWLLHAALDSIHTPLELDGSVPCCIHTDKKN